MPTPHNLPRVLVERTARSHGALRIGVEGVRDDRLALRLGGRPDSRRRRVQRPPEPLDVERVLDHAEGRHRGAERPAGMRRPRCSNEYRRRRDQLCEWLGDRTAHPPRQAGGRVLSVSGRLRVPLAGRHPHVRGARAGVARRRPRGGDARRGVRRARVPADLVRDVDRGAETRHRADPRPSCGRSKAGKPSPGRSRPISSRRSSTPLVARRRRRRTSGPTRRRAHVYGTDALKRGHPADVVVLPGHDRGGRRRRPRLRGARRVPIVPRGGGTGYTGGSVPVARRRRAVARAHEPHPRDRRGEPPRGRRAERHHRRPAGRGREGRTVLSTGSRVAAPVGRSAATSRNAPAARARSSTAPRSVTCSGWRRCSPTGEIIETGGKVVKNVVGYDLTQLLVGSEGTLAIITKVILRLVPKPPVQTTLRATFRGRRVGGRCRHQYHPGARRPGGARARSTAIRSRRSRATSNVRSLAPEGTEALLLLEVDGMSAGRRGGGRARRAGLPRRRAPPRSCARATKRSARSCGACAASCRCR